MQEEAMSRFHSPFCFSPILYFLVFFFSSFHLIHSQTFHSNASLSTTWLNQQLQSINTSNTGRGFPVRVSIIVSRESSVARFICGFYCTQNSNLCYFGVLISREDERNGSSGDIVQSSLAVWSANRNNPVGVNATVNFTNDGDLILSDADGTRVWSTNTGGKSVSGLNLTDTGNLVLFDSKNRLVWQSFDHPTDCLVIGQRLFSGLRLIASASEFNSSEGMYSLVVENGSLVAYIQSNPPLVYYHSDLYKSYAKFENGSFDKYPLRPATTAQVLKFDTDGHLRHYVWSGSNWDVIRDTMYEALGFCGFPMACGRYGICSNSQCGCPEASNGVTSFFKPVRSRQPTLGCSLATPINCNNSSYHSLQPLANVTYFDMFPNWYGHDMDLESCKEACLRNCSCNAAIFVTNIQSVRGNCSLRDEVFSFEDNEGSQSNTNVSVFLKVQQTSVGSERKSRNVKVILGSSLGALFGFVLILGVFFILIVKYIKLKIIEDVYLYQVPGMPSRFSYEDLKDMTNNFSKKLGEGGFGSVFEGTLKNGDKIAVKQLEGLDLAKQSFLAEVQTIGSIHHVNLVRLIGFCAEKSYRLLVYEYMGNGSLDKWIFCENKDNALGWLSRKKIILDVAKGLAYLHEECRQKIIHLDIKPQNILLSENFNAKVADFGLSKLIEKDQSQVVTKMRGTVGYMAPEWLSSVITEKVDVYSFGVMVLEILSGRKNLDWSQPEETAHLLRIFKEKAENNELEDLVDKSSEDMQLNRSDVVETMKVAVWCVQSDFRRRPSMSDVIRVLEGTMEVETNLDYEFLIPPSVQRLVTDTIVNVIDTIPLPSNLSGPR